MIGTSQFKKGLKILYKGEPYIVIDFQHVKPGKGNQFTRTKLKHLVRGGLLDLTVRSGEKFSEPDVEYKDMGYLYEDQGDYYFMDQDSYEQIKVGAKTVGHTKHYLIENGVVKICFLNEEPVTIEVPKTVVMKIKNTEPGVKGNSVTNVTKPATLETGLTLQVPLHINEGDEVKVNTSDGSYIERVKINKT